MNYALTRVYGTDPDTGREILIAHTGQPIPANLDDQVAAQDKSATPPVEAQTENPDTRVLFGTFPAVATAVDGDQALGEVPFAGKVIGASYTPEANITGANTDTRTLRVINKGQDGNGSTVVATLAFTTGVNANDFDEKAFTVSAVAGATDVVKGDILVVASVHGGSGLADPGGLVQVQVNPSIAD